MHRDAGERRGLSPLLAASGMLLAAACAPSRPPPDGSLHVSLAIAGRVQRDLLLTHPADPRHGCGQPRRARLPSAAGPAPADDEPPNIVFGYTVEFGPHFLPEAAGLTPEWRGYGPQTRFTLEVLPRPGALDAAGPVALGRAFRISVGTAEGLWQRDVAPDDPPSAGRVRIDPDGMGGRFSAAGLVLRLPHNRLPDTEAISVAGTWRCPAR
jgi:hypothetical protein